MPEGLFTPDQVELTGIKHERINAALVRIKPRTRLILDVVDTQDQVTRLSRNESDADGTERWFRYFLKDDLKRIDDPAFRMGMVRWEFSQLVKSGARFPAETWLDGGGSGFCISAAGLILTN